ncbi:unnamed protein product [Zymoseptoria tritici ST99CH_1A5]|uniref:Uncharacterized protein n=3 Tax=Zymoseptoria tritici TaxID=1047171 RepID=A0A1X7RRU8_ZYMT9|nr:unnamed protein product [Zymoseptoria tritici ST99CH_3D7]SMR50910.1 unnamed protein product [Zymoseptoria tritici ST99CH_1E4]SMY23604.1 unnamed protein product [Zymoseptoria tritici ST99CH_1A5]
MKGSCQVLLAFGLLSGLALGGDRPWCRSKFAPCTADGKTPCCTEKGLKCMVNPNGGNWCYPRDPGTQPAVPADKWCAKEHDGLCPYQGQTCTYVPYGRSRNTWQCMPDPPVRGG